MLDLYHYTSWYSRNKAWVNTLCRNMPQSKLEFFKSLKLCLRSFSEIPCLRTEQSCKHCSFNRLFPSHTSTARQTNLGWRGKSIGTSLICIVHQFFQVLQILQKENKPELVAAVSFIIVCSSPLADILIRV